MASLRFNLKPAANNKLQIRAIFQDGKAQTPKNIGESIPANKIKEEYRYWDKTKQRVKVLDDAERINAIIEKWTADFSAYKDDCKRNVKKVDIQLFIRSLEQNYSLLSDSHAPTLIPIITSFRNSLKQTHGTITKNSYKSLEGDITAFQKERKRPILISDVGSLFFKEFSDFLIRENNNFNATINRKQKQIVTILNYAKNDLKIKVEDDYSKRKTFKESKAPKFPLRPEELATLEAYTPKSEYHRLVIDAFLLSCDTGLRYSDVKQLQAAHIKTHVAENEMIRYIDLTNMKSDNANNMPLSNRAASIIDRYIKPNGKLFRFDYSQSVSRALKAIFEDAELNRPCEVVQMQGAKTTRELVPLHDVISFHTARNTYITRLLAANVAPVFVQRNAGHSDIKITMGYFRNDDLTRWQATLPVLNMVHDKK